jgi:hypothetical protein
MTRRTIRRYAHENQVTACLEWTSAPTRLPSPVKTPGDPPLKRKAQRRAA